jgi:hypothetical protein
MQTDNAIKKLKKLGFAVESAGNQYSASRQNSRDAVEFIDQKGTAICIGIRRLTHHHDWQRDYCATIFCKNLSQAIRLASPQAEPIT